MDARWYFDFISPFSYLQLRKVLALRERVALTPVPVVFGALLAHHGNVGPGEIPGKREFTYAFVLWQAERAGIPLVFPPAHPFNPIAALRLAIAAGSGWDAVLAIYEHLWAEGKSGATADELASVARGLGVGDPVAATESPAVKAALRANTDEAIAAGVFGVPTLRIGGHNFWGDDATPMAEDFLADPRRFEGEAYQRIATLPTGIVRKR